MVVVVLLLLITLLCSRRCAGLLHDILVYLAGDDLGSRLHHQWRSGLDVAKAVFVGLAAVGGVVRLFLEQVRR